MRRGGDGAGVGGRRPAGRSSQGAPPLWAEHKADRTPGGGERERRTRGSGAELRGRIRGW